MPRKYPIKDVPKVSPEIAARFWSNVRRRGPNDCWEWTAGCGEDGRGRFRIGKRTYYAPRVALAIHTGKSVTSDSVLHDCDNPPCCNPKHLFAGTNMDNVADRDRKGRTARGESSRSDLRETQVRAIRRSKQPHHTLAKRYRVGKSTIGRIKRREVWGHVA